MNRLHVLAAVLLSATVTAHAAETPEKKSQQSRMATCSADAKEKALKGDARKQFMSECLSSKGPKTSEQSCAAGAREKGLKGDARKQFIDQCTRARPQGSVG